MNSIRRFFNHFPESWHELKKVRWPSRGELFGFSLAVIVICVLITLFFAVIDLGLSRALELFFNRPVNDQIYNTNTIDPGIPVSDNVSEMGTAPENTTGETTEQNTEQTPSESPDAGANEPDTSPAPPSE